MLWLIVREVIYSTFDSDASTIPTRATSVTTSPIQSNSIIVSPNDRHLVCLGTNEYAVDATVSGTFNPMLVRWSDQDDRTNWVPFSKFHCW